MASFTTGSGSKTSFSVIDFIVGGGPPPYPLVTGSETPLPFESVTLTCCSSFAPPSYAIVLFPIWEEVKKTTIWIDITANNNVNAAKDSLTEIFPSLLISLLHLVFIYQVFPALTGKLP